jgi:hypothetical protein
MSQFTGIVILASAAAFVGATLLPREVYDKACTIKGNISINSGERIYHVPGQEYYAATKIRSEHGERWFCSEAEARGAGWREAHR